MWDVSKITVASVLAVLTLAVAGSRRCGFDSRVTAYLRYLWAMFLVFTVSEVVSFQIAVWFLGCLCFVGLREFFTLVDIRLQDRWGVVGAYLAIPFMVYFISIDWYGLFIISIPVYAFLAVPFLIALGGKEMQGAVLSIGAIDFGLFMLVYCLGHIGYLSLFSTWMAIMLVVNVAVCDLVAHMLDMWGRSPWNWHGIKYFVAVPLTIGTTVAFSTWTGIPLAHNAIVGVMFPVLVAVGRYTFVYIKSDLRISRECPAPGKGQLIDSISSSLYTAPVVFHYIRYFVLPEGS